MPVVFIPFFAFFICGLLQFNMLRGVRRVLAQRHPEIWLDISTRVWFIENAVVFYIWRRKDKKLNDPLLTKAVKRAIAFYFFTFLVWTAIPASLFTGLGLTKISFEKEPVWHPVLTPIEIYDRSSSSSSAL